MDRVGAGRTARCRAPGASGLFSGRRGWRHNLQLSGHHLRIYEKRYTEAQAEALITRSVTLFLEAREQWWEAEGKNSGRVYPLCLAGIGPYGAYLADGSEYTGAYDITPDELRAFHQRRMELLWQAGADLLLIETQPSLAEALIEAQISEEMEADYWISFSCRDGLYTNAGDSIVDCARAFASGHPHCRMIGVNCTPPEHLASLVRALRSACDLPIAVYPNSGQTYDADTKTWQGVQDQTSFYEYALRWMEAGARMVGGCCRTHVPHIQQIVQARQTFLRENQ